MQPEVKLPPPQRPITTDPTKASRSLAIALVVAGILLVAAAGVITWLFMIRAQTGTPTANTTATDDVKNVKNVSFVAPANLPPGYVKNDQSKVGMSQVFYYDDATSCGFTVSVAPVREGQSIKDTAVEVLTSAQAQGITTASRTDSDTYDLKDADDAEKTYEFASINLEQDVKVDGVPFTKQQNAILYKQFGQQIASLSYACKTDTWTDKKAELATLVSAFTVKTER